MTQDFNLLIESYFQSIMDSSDLVPLPIALVDENLTQFWENQYLKDRYPFLCSKDNVISMMKGYDLSSVILAMRTQDASFSCPSRLPMVNTVLTFSPLYDDAHVWIGAAVHFSVSSSELFPSDTNLSQKMLQNFNIALRDPLGSIFSGICSMARRLEVEDIVSCEMLLQQLNQHCYHMLKSCSILSEYTAYSNGLAERNLKLVSLNPYLEDLFKHLQMVVRCVGIQLSFHLPSEQIDLNLDPDKLVIVLTCLLSNSIAFADPDAELKTIHIEVSVSKRSVRFVVSDNGLGIPSDVLPHVFDPYFTSSREDLHFSHLGLGLTVCKMIVNHHDGDISIFSSEKGTSVSFTISRSLQSEHPGELTFCDNPVEYITNSYSPMYIYLSDVCEWSAI